MILVTLDVTPVNLGQTATTSLGAIIGTFMDNVALSSPTTEQQELFEALNAITDPNVLDNALDQIAPLAAQPLQIKNMHVMQQQQLNTRLAALHGNYYMAGDLCPDYGVWIQPFFNDARQKDINNLLGYKAQVGGILFGIDTELNRNVVIGIGASYAYAVQKSLTSSATKTNINNYLAMLYGTYYFKNNAALDWLVAGGPNDCKNNRVLQVSPVNVNATSSYVGQQYSTQAILSKRYHKSFRDKQKCLDLNFIPQINANYIYVLTPAYTEQNAGTLGMSINSTTASVLTLGTGMQLENLTIINRHECVPEIHGYIYYDVKNGNISSNSTFVNGGPVLSINSNQGRLTGQFGLSFTYNFTHHLACKLEYDLQLKSRYYNNIAFVNLRYTF